MSEEHPHPSTPAETVIEHSETQHSLINQSSDDFVITAAEVLAARPHVQKEGNESDSQALEGHEVIELQAFSERKAWIEEKIKFLEKLPPVEVFFGSGALRTSSEEIPGLPTREQLDQWLIEHDRIEKETEIFDAGELKKLRKFTKAATQRNLSPQDTDLIELTLTTIYEMDKLLHLLRARSDNLDLLSVRLTWEERRIVAWKELRQILADLRTFLDTRVRWSPDVYESNSIIALEESPVNETGRRRKNSVTSMMSVTSESSYAPTPAFSRGTRFRLSEALSHDAAQFSSRISSLRHTKIAGAGKALDKLIDQSREKVPDELLDEQDKLEDHGINDLEDLGKFIMHVIMQWKKADEIYVETLKDEYDAQNLLEEMEIAQFNHPTARQDASFLSRTNTLSKRLLVRGNPASPNSSFPRPTHGLFPEQQESNDAIIATLSNAISSATEYVRKAEAYAKDYHASYDTVKRVETICKAASGLSEQLDSIVDRLQNGGAHAASDGTPPDHCTEACLEASAHSIFLALLPSILEELQDIEVESKKVEQNAKIAFVQVDRPGVDPDFISAKAAELARFIDRRSAALQVRDDVLARCTTLETARELWAAMPPLFQEIGDRRTEIVENMERQMWKKQFGHHDLPLTPESPAAPLPPTVTTTIAMQERLDTLHARINEVVVMPLSSIPHSARLPVCDHLATCAAGLSGLVDGTREVVQLWESVQDQVAGMAAVRDEAHNLQVKLEDLKVRFDQTCHNVLLGEYSPDQLQSHEASLAEELRTSRATVEAFQNALPLRVKFVSQSITPESSSFVSHKRRFSVSGKFSLELLQQASPFDLPFDPVALDNTVRADLNSYSMMLSGAMQSLEQKASYLLLVKSAREIDGMGESIAENIRRTSEDLSSLQTSLLQVEEPDKLVRLGELKDRLQPILKTIIPQIGQSLSTMRVSVQELKSSPTQAEAGLHEKLCLARQKSFANLETQFQGLSEVAATLQKALAGGVIAEEDRLAELQRAKEALQRQEAEEAARLEREVAEGERSRLRLEEQMREQALEAKRIAEMQKAEQEMLERNAIEKAKLAQLAKERQEEADEFASQESTLETPVSRAGRWARDQFPHSNDFSHRRTRTEAHIDDDVFGFVLEPSPEILPAQKLNPLQAQIHGLRKRLHSLSLSEIVRPDSRSGISLPGDDQRVRIQETISQIAAEVVDLRTAVAEDSMATLELRSLEEDLSDAQESMSKLHRLADFSMVLQSCDDSLSDLLEHIDSYPSPPAATMSTSYLVDLSKPPEEQLLGRLSFVKVLAEDMKTQSTTLPDYVTVQSECERVLQTWSELEAMGIDRVNGQKSRPPSVLSSDQASPTEPTPSKHMKKASYSNLSVSSGRFLAPPPMHVKRRVSSSSIATGHSRSSSRMSVGSSIRSVSGPVSSVSPYPISSTLYSSTFASRQRTNSVASETPSSTPVAKRPPVTLSRPPTSLSRARPQMGQLPRVTSPVFSEASFSQSRSSLNLSRSSNRSSWSRAPRQSFPNVLKSPPPRPKPTVKKPYIANPQNKLDVAVGDVLNKLSVNINVEVVADTWKDQSGKYWIGDQEPKLCFCRILRSQTVMVRVGGGWSELSKFIKEHFADAFRLLPESPLRPGTREEKWISSATLSHSIMEEPPEQPPRTPEPKERPIPILVSTPGGSSPHSVKSGSSPGSPLRAMQFIRRADNISPSMRPETPIKKQRSKLAPALNTPANTRPPVWRP